MDFLREWLTVVGPLVSAAAIIIPAVRKWLIKPLLFTIERHAEQHERMDRVAESIDRLSEALVTTQNSVATQLAERNAVADRRFTDLAASTTQVSNRLAMLEVRQSKDTQRVVDAVNDAASQLTNGDAT